MGTTHKYHLPVGEPNYSVEMPFGAQIIHVDSQHGNIYIWALVNTDNPKTKRTFEVYGTGWEINNPHPLNHLGTAKAGNFIWHVFEVK